MSNAVPYDFGEAKAAIERASVAMKQSEQFVRDAFQQYAGAERAYRKALAEKILELRSEGVAATVTQDLAKGHSHVADLRYRRDVAEGLKEAAVAAQWRHTADRRELEQLVAWSMRVSPDGQYEQARLAA